MTDINLKTLTPDTSLPTTGFLFGADSQASTNPSVYSTQTVATTLLGSTSLTGDTLTADAPVLNLAQTWNNGAVTFTGLKFNATSTASASASLLMDLQVGTVSRASISKDAFLTLKGIDAEISIGYPAETNLRLQQGGVIISSVGALFFSSSATAVNGGNVDTRITRKAAANLQLGAADAASPVAQTLSVQSVVAGTSNTAGAAFTITGSQGTGTGAGGSLIFQVAPAGSAGAAQNALQTTFILPATAGEARVVNSTGGSGTLAVSSTANTNVTVNFKHSTNSDGTSGTNAGFVGRVSGNFGLFDGGAAVQLAVPSGATDRIAFFGTTSAFPALKRSTTFLQARLADDSAFTNIQGKLTTDTAYTAGALVATGYITIYDSTGTAYRVPCLV